jgi:hypothetical protein
MYCLVFYSFFTYIIHKKYSYNWNNRVADPLILGSYPLLEVNSKETKIFLDLKYRQEIGFLSNKLFSCSLDTEGKILGYRIVHNQKISFNPNNFTINLNRKLIHSTFFGSIKLIKI